MSCCIYLKFTVLSMCGAIGYSDAAVGAINDSFDKNIYICCIKMIVAPQGDR